MLIAISGGIGSGKSVVAHMLMSMGYEVYDCDNRARRLIDESKCLREAIGNSLGRCCLSTDGSLDRKVVSDIVFKNPDKLASLNRITHAAVREDIDNWRKCRSEKTIFVETAILYQSEIDKMVDAVIEVTAPVEIRIKRVMHRNNLSYDEVLNRINAQNNTVMNPHPRVFTIINDGIEAVLPQLHDIMNILVSK